MEQHAVIGAQIVEQVLVDVAPIIRHHHEAYDGSGYPDRLQGEAIPLEARIIAVADAFDAMTTDRAYRSGISSAEAIAVLQAGRDKQWQGDLIDVLVTYLEQEHRLPLPEEALVGQVASWERNAQPRD
jgi:HD-GYP domain-containing protein (c-di-GMP phosphodiesterase class II)